MQPNDAQALIRAAQQGDERAFAALYEQYYTPLFRYVLARTGDAEAAEDITQSTFMKLFQRLEKVGEPVHLGYFYAAARNGVVDYYRKKGNQPVEASEEMLDAMPDPQVDVEAEVSNKISFEVLHNAINRLPEEQREVVLLRYIEGLNGRETAEALGKTEESTRQLQTRAVKNLRKLMGNYDEE